MAFDPDELTLDRRRLLWRDTATILIGVILAILAIQTIVPGANGGPEGSATPYPTGVNVGSVPIAVTLPPGVTFGPIVNPSLDIDATPTPIPVITLGPPTPKPSPSPSPSPKASPKVTPKPTPKPTPAPPNAAFTWVTNLLDVTFTNTSTGDTSWSWDFGDGSSSTAENPSHTYLAPGDYPVILTVTGPGGSDSLQHNVTVDIVPP